MPSGTSIKGPQIVLDSAPFRDNMVSVAIAGDWDVFPRRAGYVFVCLTRPVAPTQSLVLLRDSLHVAGGYWRIPDLARGGADELRVWVNWHFAGVEWTAESFFIP